eukprot:2788127-Pyramimonas_sp.AAC.1
MAELLLGKSERAATPRHGYAVGRDVQGTVDRGSGAAHSERNLRDCHVEEVAHPLDNLNLAKPNGLPA